MREGKNVIENNSHQSKISACRLSKKQIVCAYKADFFYIQRPLAHCKWGPYKRALIAVHHCGLRLPQSMSRNPREP